MRDIILYNPLIASLFVNILLIFVCVKQRRIIALHAWKISHFISENKQFKEINNYLWKKMGVIKK